ncbi:MAG TPA: hypothetical protein VGM88_14990 [Kofleriaceae bacterium]|jgi:hypothetical protein
MTTRLTLAPYLSSWDPHARTLAVRVLAAPDGDPREPLAAGMPAFADVALKLDVRLFGSTAFPVRGTTPDQRTTLALAPPANRRAVMDAIDRTFPSPPDAGPPPVREIPSSGFQKFLPATYRSSFTYGGPRVGGASDTDAYLHALRCGTAVPILGRKKSLSLRTWSDRLALAMRQPALLEAMGMLATISIPVPAAIDHGWLALELAADGPYGAAATVPAETVPWLRRWMTRIPLLPADRARPVFTGVLFPFATTAPAALDAALDEATRFDDGFAKIVHAKQPTTAELHQEDDTTAPPKEELGVRVAWDDEDVLAGLNRSIAPDVATPRGVVGYRIDVREGTGAWSSLAAARAKSLRLDGLDLGAWQGELRLDVTPQRVAEGAYWILPYYARWTGGSTVIADPLDAYLRGRRATLADPSAIYEAVPPGVELRYGHSYDLRVRMVDATGGGPGVDVAAEVPGESPIATVHLRRWVPLGRAAISAVSASGMRIARPPLAYPTLLYAAGSGVRDTLVAARAAGRELSLPDPDAVAVEIAVKARLPAFDPAAGDDGYETLYTTRRAYPDAVDGAIELAFEPVDVAQVDGTFVADAAATSGAIRVPSARDVRLSVRAIGRDDPTGTYFGGDAARGAEVTGDVKLAATREDDLLRALDPAATIRAVFLRAEDAPATPANVAIPATAHPGDEIVARLADGLGLRASGDTLLGGAGRRVVFGCAGAGHRAAPDSSSVTLLALSELVGVWCVAVRVDVARDWTWRGISERGVRVRRTFGTDAGPTELGFVQLLPAVGATALEGEPARDATSFVFVDVFAPPATGGFPTELDVRYDVAVELASGTFVDAAPAVLHLPVVTAPPQVPSVASVGIAQSPYVTASDDGASQPRVRMLWIELAEPIADPRDALFARVLAHTPDPLLLANADPAADPPPYPDLPISDELARTIVPGQGDDGAGLGAMQLLSASDRQHFLLPVPPGMHAASPELLGFFTYELRIGHDATRWTTARARFGAPLVLEGVQHPAPELVCSVQRTPHTIDASAPYARPYYRGRSVLPAPPTTELWFSLYALVARADGAGFVNVQVSLQRGATSGPRDRAYGAVTWDEPSVTAALGALGLPATSPLGILAVELLPEPLLHHADPLGHDLGEVRLLRTSPLVRVMASGC